MSQGDETREVVVELDRVGIRHGRRAVVDGVSLAIERGTVYALLGRNGSGKSSLVRGLLGQRRLDAGAARAFGRDAWRERAALMARIGVVPEEPDAPSDLTVRALEWSVAGLYARWDRAGVADRLARADVPWDVPFGRLSKGQKGQVALALALGHAPELLVLDDPTLGLDVAARRAVFGALIGELADRGTTVLLATHELAAVEGLADRVGVLHAGRLAVDEPTEELKGRVRRVVVPQDAWEAGSPPFAVREAQVHGRFVHAVTTDFDAERFASLAARCPAECAPMSLEEIFIAITSATPVAEGAVR